MDKGNIVKLSDDQRRQLLDLTKKGKVAARKLNRAHILLALAVLRASQRGTRGASLG